MSRNQLGPAVVYLVTNAVNGNTYVGVTSRALALRLREHFTAALSGKGNGRFYRAIRRYGVAVFSISEIHVCQTLGDAKQDEIRMIALLKPPYNSTKGGDGQLGREMSDETRRKIGAVHKGNTYRKGATHTSEVRERLRHLGFEPEAQARFRQYAHLGPKASSKPVICLDDGAVFESASAAARAYGLDNSLIVEVCLRDTRRVAAGGKIFRYVGGYEDAAVELAEVAARRAKFIDDASRRSRKSVICLDDGRVYTKTAAAGAAYGIHPSFIAEVCRGEKRSAHGLVFRYAEKEGA